MTLDEVEDPLFSTNGLIPRCSAAVVECPFLGVKNARSDWDFLLKEYMLQVLN